MNMTFFIIYCVLSIGFMYYLFYLKGEIKMKTKKIEKMSNKAKKQLVRRVVLTSYVLNIIFVLTLLFLFINKATRFSITHRSEVKNFAESYEKVRDAAKDASNQVLQEWIESNRVK